MPVSSLGGGVHPRTPPPKRIKIEYLPERKAETGAQGQRHAQNAFDKRCEIHIAFLFLIYTFRGAIATGGRHAERTKRKHR